MINPKISICVPFHWMENWPVFLSRCLMSIEAQTFKDYEVILMKVGTMPVTSNRVISAAKGELVKILYMDDYLAHANSLQEIVDNFKDDDHWLVTGCLHQKGQEEPSNYHSPFYNENIYTGANTIGSPSVLTFRRDGSIDFDENLSWLLDCDLYERYFDLYGLPKILDMPNVIIGIGDHQTSNLMHSKEKQKEQDYLMKKYA